MNTENEVIPKLVSVTRTFSYDTEEVKRSFQELHGETPTDEEVLELVWEWACADHVSPIGKRQLVMIDYDTGEKVD